ncbi:MAG TPA: Clp protease N-terminal domain-containing protein [Streptosporangiaceae bacterium]|nr:Clp protease N-terminal domain-containing protein [Streptosporangiaceae bacterium]
MFERFTDRARSVVVLAQEEARLLNHDYIGTEHLLLGLIRESEGIAAKALTLLGIELDTVRENVEEIVGRGTKEPSGHIPFTPRAKKVLELSLREALQLSHNYIGTEHILLGLIREGEGVAAQVLVQLGADLSRVRQQVIQLLHGPGGGGEATAGAGPLSRLTGRRDRALLSGFRTQLTAIVSRLTAVEQRVGVGPDTSELDGLIAQVTSERRAAADAQDYERAATLRDRERTLLADKASREQEWAAAHPDLPSLAETVRQLGQEVRRLRALLSRPGIEPKDDEKQDHGQDDGEQGNEHGEPRDSTA